MLAQPSAAAVTTVTMGPCAISIMVVMVVSVNLAQEQLTKLASIPNTAPTSAPLNAKVFASSTNAS